MPRSTKREIAREIGRMFGEMPEEARQAVQEALERAKERAAEAVEAGDLEEDPKATIDKLEEAVVADEILEEVCK